MFPLTKLLGAALLAVTIAAGALGFFLKQSYKENGELTAAKAQLEQDLKDANKSIDDLLAQQLELSELIQKGDSEKRALRAEIRQRRAAHEQLKQDNAVVREWSDEPLPESILDRLRRRPANP